MQEYRSREQEGWSRGPSPVSRESEAELEDYLDHMTAEMVGVVPYRRRQELREEIRSHLRALADAFEELGSSPAEAVAQALAQFGEPRAIARQWTQEWHPRAARPLDLKTGFWSAAPWMVLPALLAWVRSLNGAHDPLFGSFEMVVLWPLLFGSLAGYLGRGSRVAGACLAMAGCILVTVVISTAAPSGNATRELSQLLATQIFGWMPLGLLATGIAARVRDRQEGRPPVPHQPYRA